MDRRRIEKYTIERSRKIEGNSGGRGEHTKMRTYNVFVYTILNGYLNVHYPKI